jgi:hypothetical protein
MSFILAHFQYFTIFVSRQDAKTAKGTALPSLAFFASLRENRELLNLVGVQCGHPTSTISSGYLAGLSCPRRLSSTSTMVTAPSRPQT